MIWNYFKRKLGIKDYEDSLIDLSTKTYTSITLLSSCIKELEDIKTQLGYIDKDYCPEKKLEMLRILGEIQKDIKTIPKEIVVKNVLSI